MTTDQAPQPTPDALTRPYWEGAQARRFILPRCEACGRWHFYPRPSCPHCASDRIAWAEASGSGTIFSVTEVRRAPSPAFTPPYAVAIVALDEGPHLMTTIVDCAPAAATIGSRVEVTFVARGDGLLPAFRLET